MFGQSPKGSRLRQLVALGMSQEAMDLINSAVNRASSLYAQIRSEDGRTSEWVTQQLETTYERAKADLDSKLDDLLSGATRSMNADYDRVFGTDGIPGDRSLAAMSLRDAMSRVAEMTDAQELGRMLSIAEGTGDEALARAVARRAMESGATSVVNAFLSTRPRLADAASRLSSVDVDSARDFALIVAMLGLRPPE